MLTDCPACKKKISDKADICNHCGFAGRQLHWFCPGCKYWGTIKVIKDVGSEEWNHP